MRLLHLVTISALAVSAAAQTTVHSNLAPRATATVIAGSDVGAPSLRYWGGWASDGTSMFNFGGRGVDTLGNALSTYMNDLAAYNPASNTWTTLSAQSAVGSPSDRFRAAFAHDPVGNRLVLFGGASGPGISLSDCWEFDLNTNTWNQIPNPTPGTTGPTGRFDGTMQYDAATSSLILFGGQQSNTTTSRTGDTWLLSGSTWVQLAPANSPSARGLHAMTSRGAPYNDIILVAGRDAANVRQADTWRWDGAAQDWQAVTPINNTLPVTWVSGNAAVYDAVRQVVTIISGPGHNFAPSNTTSAGGWTSEFDCVTNEWRAFGNNTATQSADDPIFGNLQRFCVAYVNGKTYFWAGQNPATPGDANLAFVKEYQAAPLATATAYGTGCTGPGGLLTMAADNTPWTGRTFAATCTNVGTGSLAMTVWGTTQASTPLIVLLPQAGAGCLLLNDAFQLEGPSLVAGGSVTAQLPIPYDPALAGFTLNCQIAELEFDLGFNWTGLYTSNGVEFTIGAL
jgi:hypothetical protein